MSDRPNILFLLNDHQAYYRHGWDNGPKVRRPNFERLASEGIEFNRAYTASPLCGPARRTLLTGLYPHNHGEVRNDVNHPFTEETYLDLLSAAGYRNFYYGKWHAGPGTAHDHGCEGFSYPSYNNPYTKSEYKEYLREKGLPEPEVYVERTFWPGMCGSDIVYRQDKGWCNEHASGVMLTPKETHEAFFLAELACRKLRELKEEDDSRPFALRVDFWGPHQPYFPTQAYIDMYPPEEIPEYPSFRDDLENKPDIYKIDGNYGISENGRLVIPNPLPWSEWQKVLSRCYAQITMVDEAAGLILDTLEELGLAENTLVIWTTDHGDAIASHGGHFDKGVYMSEEMVRIPMAMRWPGRIKAGVRSEALVCNIDIAPTILDAAGTEFSGKVDGESLLPLAEGRLSDEEFREELMCETHGHGILHIGRLVVTERYKYVYNRGQMDELYDLVNDPYEMENLVDSPEYRDVLEDMKKRLERWRMKTGDPYFPDEEGK